MNDQIHWRHYTTPRGDLPQVDGKHLRKCIILLFSELS